jgi:limonene-1,2-epoxide hydrolase
VTRVRLAAALALLASGLAAAGCGGGAGAGPGPVTTPAPAPTPSTSPPATSPGPASPAAPPAAERVIRRWASTLRHGDVAGATDQFALPAIVQIDPGRPAVRLTRRRDVRAFNRSLPCGATVIRTERHGAYAEVLFRLVQRPGAVCDGPGHTARAAFRVRDGRIVEWRRRLDQPGDDRVQPPPPGGGDSGSGAPPTV